MADLYTCNAHSYTCHQKYILFAS